jgi:hypothetical protein
MSVSNDTVFVWNSNGHLAKAQFATNEKGRPLYWSAMSKYARTTGTSENVSMPRWVADTSVPTMCIEARQPGLLPPLRSIESFPPPLQARHELGFIRSPQIAEFT